MSCNSVADIRRCCKKAIPANIPFRGIFDGQDKRNAPQYCDASTSVNVKWKEERALRLSGAIRGEHLLIFVWRQGWKAFMDSIHGIINICTWVYF